MAALSKASLLNVSWALLVAATIGVGGDALAQQPSQAQLNALRQSCRGDYMAHCSSVPTGGAPALNCLKQHLPTLSPGCQTAVNAVSPAAPPGAAPSAAPSVAAAAPTAPPEAPSKPVVRVPASASKPSQAQGANIRRACAANYKTHCAGIPPGGSASVACLKRNARTLSAPCQQALGVAAGATTVVAAAPAPVEPAPLLVTPREEMFLQRNACRADYATLCGGLRPGLGRIAACLHYNGANLSPRCQQALAALREGR
jgi:hypothetical protein